MASIFLITYVACGAILGDRNGNNWIGCVQSQEASGARQLIQWCRYMHSPPYRLSQLLGAGNMLTRVRLACSHWCLGSGRLSLLLQHFHWYSWASSLSILLLDHRDASQCSAGPSMCCRTGRLVACNWKLIFSQQTENLEHRLMGAAAAKARNAEAATKRRGKKSNIVLRSESARTDFK